MSGLITLAWSPPPTGLLGPGARRTGCYVYQVFDAAGRKLHGGTNGPDLDAAIAWAKGLALKRGLADPTVEIVSAAPR